MATAQKTDTVLEVEGLSVTIRTPAGPLHAVRDISFDVRLGAVLLLLNETVASLGPTEPEDEEVLDGALELGEDLELLPPVVHDRFEDEIGRAHV